MIRENSFKKISVLLNWGLIVLGILLLIYQLNGYFTFEDHLNNEVHQNQMEINVDKHQEKNHTHSHDQNDTHHSHDEHHHRHD